MTISFSTTVQAVRPVEILFNIAPVAGIRTVRPHCGSSISYRDGPPAAWQGIRPGMRIQVSGKDDGTSQLQVQQLVIIEERVQQGEERSGTPDRPRPARESLALLSRWLNNHGRAFPRARA